MISRYFQRLHLQHIRNIQILRNKCGCSIHYKLKEVNLKVTNKVLVAPQKAPKII